MTESVRAWRPDVPGVREVLHATFREHAYPAHAHDAWTVLLIDEGAVIYGLDREPHVAEPSTVTLLPPGVPHDGRSARAGRSFRKRVLYLESDWLPPTAIGAAVDRPTVARRDVGRMVRAAHVRISVPGEALAAESAVLGLRELLLSHVGRGTSRRGGDAPLAQRLRDLLEERWREPFTLAEAGRILGAHPSHLVRVFSRAYGIPPHRYVTSRRIDAARGMLLRGVPAGEVAAEAGFHDQAHLTRHFRRVLGATPAAFAAG